MATRAQLLALRKKHHLGEFSRKSTRFKKSNGVSRSMAKRRRTSTKRRSYRRGASMGTVWATVLGVGGFIAYEVLLRPKIQSTVVNPLLMSVGEIALGLWLSRKGGTLGNVGKAAVWINVYALAHQYAVPALTSLQSGMTA
jgi:hypothetical protein